MSKTQSRPRRTLAALAFAGVAMLPLPALAQTVTVYYQPTPFPLLRCNGTSSCPGGAAPQDLNIVHIHDGWLPSVYYGQTFQRDGKLEIGGWGDVYRTYLNMDLTGLPANPTNVALWLRFYPSGVATTQFQFCIPNQPWDTTLTWSSQPSPLGCTVMLGVPTTDSWARWYITSWYQNWLSGAWGKYGVMLNPQTNNNTFDLMRSSRYADFASDPLADGKRPILQFDFTPPVGMPNFKLPLRENTRWLLTGEAGGYECKGEAPWPDPAHQGNNYFALDFSPTNIKDVGGSYPANDIPILAAAGGHVAAVETSNPNGNGGQGWYITLDHGSGYYTRYLHFANRAARWNNALLNVGDYVNPGDQIGVMGGTGQVPAFATHLHMNFWYGGFQSGGSNIPQLTYVTMESLLIRSYQTECSVDVNGVPTARIRYYHSSNVWTGQ